MTRLIVHINSVESPKLAVSPFWSCQTPVIHFPFAQLVHNKKLTNERTEIFKKNSFSSSSFGETERDNKQETGKKKKRQQERNENCATDKKK